MKRAARDNCPILRATNIVGDQWSLLILREFFLEGNRRFADLQAELGLSPNTLSARLKKLEEAGLVAREVYSQHPPRADYALTEKGRAFGPVMQALYDWGEDHTPPVVSG
ncbi:helix-turn-helix transcriptional regulator [Defluviimonas sp. WL0024]|uniref:Helix-turn-helix transcriptional regulator n=2 Tax=Albidovulum TaxID=205889 RepID=A0ABT3J2E7_9RHOB|nr:MULTISPECIES: helix-turn-helix domain-containing protein [Defluviimonas]MCU9847730.1 helix-turn-helix transcriptional regulator [Defluviimonas sp. WL0024]MCW3781841.1 helix-turn-helix transcriptional regulator [Defluviimonas salinarum]